MVKISTNIKNFIETITKGLFYTKTEMDTKLNGKADSNHKHNDVFDLKQVDSIYPNLPVWFMVKNGWCIVQWENPIAYLLNEGVDVPNDMWFVMGDVPIPQTGNTIYYQRLEDGGDYRIQVTDRGVIETYLPYYPTDWYDTLVYPTESTTNPV